jgi:hypothetical protein
MEQQHHPRVRKMTELKINEDAEETVTAKVLKGIQCICSLPAKFDGILKLS